MEVINSNIITNSIFIEANCNFISFSDNDGNIVIYEKYIIDFTIGLRISINDTLWYDQALVADDVDKLADFWSIARDKTSAHYEKSKLVARIPSEIERYHSRKIMVRFLQNKKT